MEKNEKNYYYSSSHCSLAKTCCLFLRRIVAQNGNKNASVIDKQREEREREKIMNVEWRKT